jgi:hypothetical protein
MKRVGSIVSLVLAGFFLYTFEATAFLKIPSTNSVLPAVLLATFFGVPFAFFLLLGVGLDSFRKWQRLIGVTILSANGGLALVALSFVCFLNSPTIMAAMPPSTVDLRFAYSNWPYGLVVVVLFSVLGVIFTLGSRESS